MHHRSDSGHFSSSPLKVILSLSQLSSDSLTLPLIEQQVDGAIVSELYASDDNIRDICTQ